MREADKSMYYIVEPYSFGYNPARINVGSIGYYDGKMPVIVSSLYEIFKTTPEMDDRFLWHWFKSEQLPKLIERYQEGGVRLYFYYDKLLMCSISIPKKQEQQKIGLVFDKLDTLITLHQREQDSVSMCSFSKDPKEISLLDPHLYSLILELYANTFFLLYSYLNVLTF